MLSDIALAITEATTNVVLHAYRDREVPGTVTIEAEHYDDHVCLYVRDEGTGLAPRVDSPGLGLGLGLIAQVADSADVRAPGDRRHRSRHALQRRRAPPRVYLRVQLVRSGPAGSAALELAVSHALLTRVAAGELPSTLRVYRPRADGRVRQARHARAPATRPRSPPRATTATSPSCGSPAATPPPTTRTRSGSTSSGRSTIPATGTHDRFATRGSGSRARSQRLGVDARVGEVPGEYCPGAYSVNARGRVKLIGTAQRLVRGAALLGASIVVGDGAGIRAVLATSTPRSSSSGTPPPRARSTRRSPGITVDAVEAARHRRLRRPRAGGPGRGHPRPGPPARTRSA